MRIGHGFDAHRLVVGRKLILGGVEIPFEKGALGHSDADVAAHALADALLGAAALGDLGSHFPDTDGRWKDADSMMLLSHCKQTIQRAGYVIENVDATIVLQEPRLAVYIMAMRENVAAALDIALTQVSLKAKTSEGLGYAGDGSGIAAFAVAALSRP
ncbi:MAG: 2-C-methyl-D-erythritol 2,4-cyclodiphosphate synthase [Candidatus Eremiobacteraeota bacterium]|nr:2-C-methyl-D-erythritol 2,4-cyclodiphosphate synthase [Candidatus Eremiobacteraeota bacterium]